MATDTGETELSKIYNFFGPGNDFLEEGGEWRAALTNCFLRHASMVFVSAPPDSLRYCTVSSAHPSYM